jgi:hypothetical protein
MGEVRWGQTYGAVAAYLETAWGTLRPRPPNAARTRTRSGGAAVACGDWAAHGPSLLWHKSLQLMRLTILE